ncbi:MAG: hypothetical protein NT076_00525 [Candidatus Pacearchaeota archaeon]|nr:hypothetical protein [Candidatus Pacearchaeota archaeon]
MALEDKVNGDEAIPFVIPQSDYDREVFAYHMDKLKDLEEYNAAVAQNKEDIGNLKDLADKLAPHLPGGATNEGAGRNYAELVADPHKALVAADSILGAEYVGLAKYVEKNRDEVLDKASPEQLWILVQSVPLYKTGKKEHDEIVDLVGKVKQIREAKSEQELESIVQKDVDASFKKLPVEIQGYVGVYQRDVQHNFVQYHIQRITEKFSKLFRNDKKEIDKEAIVKFLEDNYKYVEDFMEDEVKDIEPDEKKREKARAKLWNKNLKHQYVALAKALSPTEVKEQKTEDNPEWERIKAEARGQKMST